MFRQGDAHEDFTEMRGIMAENGKRLGSGALDLAEGQFPAVGISRGR